MSFEMFDPGDLLPWQEMTAKIKHLEEFLDGIPEGVILWEAILDLRRTGKWDRDQQFQLVVSLLGRCTELETKVKFLEEREKALTNGLVELGTAMLQMNLHSKHHEEQLEALTRTLDLLQEAIGIEVVVTAIEGKGDESVKL
jgi:hypothetical protein